VSNSAEDRATQGCDLSADGAADTPEVFDTSGPLKCLRFSVKSWGRRGNAPDLELDKWWGVPHKR
jgi:hypothetical protein